MDHEPTTEMRTERIGLTSRDGERRRAARFVETLLREIQVLQTRERLDVNPPGVELESRFCIRAELVADEISLQRLVDSSCGNVARRSEIVVAIIRGTKQIDSLVVFDRIKARLSDYLLRRTDGRTFQVGRHFERFSAVKDRANRILLSLIFSSPKVTCA